MDVVLASGNAQGGGNGALFLVDITTVADFVGNATIGNLDYTQLEDMINQAAQQAENNQPEGALMEIDITGWTNPITGTDYSQTVADQINSYWRGNQFTVDGEPMQAWPGNGQVAWGSQDLGIADTLVIQYVKGQPMVIFILAAIAVIAFGFIIYEYYNNTAWKVGTSCPSGEYWSGSACEQSTGTGNQTCNSGYHWSGSACVKNPNWFEQLPAYEQIALLVGGGAVVLLGVVFAMQYSLAGAGASKSTINVGG